MSHTETEAEAYRRQLAAWARALAQAEAGPLADALSVRSTLDQVKLFTDGNLDKRFSKLERQLEFLAPAWPEGELAERIVEFIRSGPLAAYDTGASDGERFLIWLTATQRLSLEQLDYVACQRARHAVEELARGDRLGYVRFMELASVAAELAEGLGWDDSIRAHLNPTRHWALFRTRALLGDEQTSGEDDRDAPAVSDAPPEELLFYAAGGEIATSLLAPRARELVRILSRIGPATFPAWLEAAGDSDRDELVELATMLAEVGLAAFS